MTDWKLTVGQEVRTRLWLPSAALRDAAGCAWHDLARRPDDCGFVSEYLIADTEPEEGQNR